MKQETIAVIIPTLDRPADLAACVDSVGTQSRPPEEVIVVDDGDLADEYLWMLHEKLHRKTTFEVIESDGPPGLSTARNTGAESASSSICLILDDDTELGRHYITRLEEIYAAVDDPKLAGVGGFDDSLRSPSFIEKLFNTIFYLGSNEWEINRAGIQSWNADVEQPVRSEWLSGNNCSYRTEILRSHPFHYWNGGREALEDIAMGWQPKNNGYFCVVDPHLEIEHHDAEMADDPIEFGIKRARNRVRIFREYGARHDLPLAVWAFVGDTLRHVLAPIVGRDISHHWSVAVGMILGFMLSAIQR